LSHRTIANPQCEAYQAINYVTDEG
jgi:hypothetical protein